MAERYQQKEWNTNSLEDHVKIIRRQINKSMKDPAVRQLATRIVSGNVEWIRDPRTGTDVPVIPFKGRFFRAPIGPLCRPKDDQCEVRAVWDFGVMNMRYVLDPEDEEGTDLYMDVTTMLMSGGGDCDDFTILYAALLKNLGYTVIARIISLDGKSWAHIYPMVVLPKGGTPRYQLPMDATENGKPLGWEYGSAKAKKDFVL